MNAVVRVEKRKWDGSVSAIDAAARAVQAAPSTLAWFVPAGSTRLRPGHTVDDRTIHDELWVTVTSEWWVLCAEADRGQVVSLVLHAAAPVDAATPEAIVWIDLDLDFEVRGDDVQLHDEAEFHRHAATMDYPREVVRGAWSGISRLAPRYTTRDWPFDGWIERTLERVGGGASAVRDAC